MADRGWFGKVVPGSLVAAVAEVAPPVPTDPAVRRAVGNWVAHDTTVRRLAEARAEPYLHHYLVEAERRGRAHGLAAALVVCLPLTVLVTVGWILVLAL
ncbi:hypothetical protein [Actinokineospora sp. NBRC 105648]|uniref:hypothetical protein n=1 Tax=Actinokineospora sp. NBRC 105648 TaxID=3032206 RepID=UPI0024A0B155|nr:hypothetical protein [Actinokineospora sp. NBRC 105648]GLZ40799.1 hypothetical protein Acsp05_44230 [Actinokineospora sp. NBRC 105648]